MHPDRKPVEQSVRDKSRLAATIVPAMWGGCSIAHASSHRFALHGVSPDAARRFVEEAIDAAMAEAPPKAVTLDQRLRVFNLEVQPGAPDHVVIWLWTPLRCASARPSILPRALAPRASERLAPDQAPRAPAAG